MYDILDTAILRETVYVLEDDDNVRELVCYGLRSSGFDVIGFEDAMAFWHGMADSLPSMVILDIMLPDEDGLAVLAKLKKSSKTAYLPVIMLTAMGTEFDRIKGLDAGADDYITKPFSVLELVARVRALLRRLVKPQVNTADISFGGLTLDTGKRTVKVQGKEVAITFKEFELLHHLLLHRDTVLSRDRLLTSIWGYEYDGTSNRTVDMHIKTLRHKLGTCGGMIKTIRGVGYKLTWEDEIL